MQKRIFFYYLLANMARDILVVLVTTIAS